jgi:hypothetical protein
MGFRQLDVPGICPADPLAAIVAVSVGVASLRCRLDKKDDESDRKEAYGDQEQRSSDFPELLDAILRKRQVLLREQKHNDAIAVRHGIVRE